VGYNNDLGIYGRIINLPMKKEVEIADCSEIKTGKASLYSTIEGNQPEEFDIEITQICNNDSNSNQNFIFKVTDPELLESTGGIVQGMSGSPIIQNNKLVGAVTHVFVNDPTKGYGIFAENMLKTAQNANRKINKAS
jgi:stage IV sporulation protein B